MRSPLQRHATRFRVFFYCIVIGIPNLYPHCALFVPASNHELSEKKMVRFNGGMNRSWKFPRQGISIKFFSVFIIEHGGEEAFRGLTTTDVCNKIIRPSTMQTSSSYCEKMARSPMFHDYIDTAQVFISHAWSYSFLDVVEALQDHFREEPNKIVWFDLFSVNQHQHLRFPFDWWTTTFESAIQDFGHTVMVFAPWKDPIPLRRAWCLWELYSTVNTKSVFEVAISSKQRQEFFEACDPWHLDIEEKLNRAFDAIDVEHSQCTKPEDKLSILQAIRQDFVRVNLSNSARKNTAAMIEQKSDELLKEDVVTPTTVSNTVDCSPFINHSQSSDSNHESAGSEPSSLIESILGSATGSATESTGGISVKSTLATFGSGKNSRRPSKILPPAPHTMHIDESPSKVVEQIPNRPTLTIAGMNIAPGTRPPSLNLPVLDPVRPNHDADYPLVPSSAMRPSKEDCFYYFQRIVATKLHDWLVSFVEEQVQQSLLINLESDRESDLLSRLNVQDLLGKLYLARQRFDEAEQCLYYVLEQRRGMLGVDHPLTLQTMNNLAICYEQLEAYEDAEKYYSDCLERQQRVLGPAHEQTLTAMYNLAAFSFQIGMTRRSMELFELCLNSRRMTLGIDDPDTLLTMHSLALVYLQEEMLQESAALLYECYAERKDALGEENILTLSAMHDLTTVFTELGHLSDADRLLFDCLQWRQRIYGDDHVETLASMEALANVYSLQGKIEKAARMYHAVWLKRQQVVGYNDKVTLTTLHNLCNALYHLGLGEQAERLMLQDLERLQVEVGSTSHSDSLTGIHNCAGLYIEWKMYTKAAEMYDELLKLQVGLHGMDHVETLMTMENLADCFAQQGIHDHAKKLYHECWERRKELLGEQHPDTVKLESIYRGLM